MGRSRKNNQGATQNKATEDNPVATDEKVTNGQSPDPKDGDDQLNPTDDQNSKPSEDSTINDDSTKDGDAAPAVDDAEKPEDEVVEEATYPEFSKNPNLQRRMIAYLENVGSQIIRPDQFWADQQAELYSIMTFTLAKDLEAAIQFVTAFWTYAEAETEDDGVFSAKRRFRGFPAISKLTNNQVNEYKMFLNLILETASEDKRKDAGKNANWDVIAETIKTPVGGNMLNNLRQIIRK